MVRHVVIWNFNEVLTEDEKTAYAKTFKERLESLAIRMEGVEELEVLTSPLPSSNSGMMLNSLFCSEEALERYQNSEAHKEIAAQIRKVVCSRVCFDYTREQ